MRSFPLYIDGQYHEREQWTYVADAEALIREPRRAFAAKRALELGRAVDPADMGLIAGRCAKGTAADNERALAAAARASRELPRALPLQVRREIAHTIVEELPRREQELLEVFIAEGHPRRLAEWEARGVVASADHRTMDWMFDQMNQRFEDDERTLILTRKPDGVVCVNPPQNAAGANATLTIGALLAGNAVVVKAPKTSPLSVMFLLCELVAPIFERYGAPPGTINVLTGYSKEILAQWVHSPLVNDIIFFGDSIAGLKFGRECVEHGKKAILEMAGNDVFVVWRDADLAAAANALTECFYGSSQICMVPKQALVHPEIAEEFISLLLALVSEIQPGYPSEAGILLSPVLKVDQFFDMLAEARQRGCELLSGGDRVDVEGEPSISGAFLQPTVLGIRGLAEAQSLRCVREETFFPLLPVVTLEAAPDAVLLERVIDFVNSNHYGLRNSLWACDPEVIHAFTSRVVNGGLIKVNESHIQFEPYLGTHGGTGLTGGPYGELHYPIFRTSHLQGIVLGRDAALSELEESGALAKELS